MPTSKVWSTVFRRLNAFCLIALALIYSGCGNTGGGSPGAGGSIRDTPAVRLNFRYEGDVPQPTLDPPKSFDVERNAAIQNDFDTNRPQELLDRTLTSPDSKHVVAVYHRVTDAPAEYRLDMYTPDGKLLRKVTSDTMAVHFPDTLRWSPDSNTLAFAAMLRALTGAVPSPDPSPAANTNANTAPPDASANSNTEPAANTDAVPDATPTFAPTPAAPTGILTFRSEQIYVCNSDGAGTRALTVNEGLIYFYFAWSPDSSMLAALAVTSREWKYMDISSASKGETLIPQGRPRIIEKNGRERRLDDNLTAVQPVWSPDSAKVALAFGNQIRLYDAIGTSPTQAAIPLRNQLLFSSQAYDRAQQRQASGGDGNVNAEPTPGADENATLPDEKLLVSFNPIVELAWTAPDLLYLRTAYIRRPRDAEGVTSFARWHRLALSVQPIQPANN